MWTIRQNETGWELVRDGEVVDVDGVSTFAAYEDVVAVLASMVQAMAALAAGDVIEGEDAPGNGLLPETWESVEGGGICFSDETGDGRNFTNCEWTWRDPAVSTVPLMLQTSTEFGHFGASLSGFATEFFMSSAGTPGARGRFYDSEVGRQFRDMLLDGRSFGVSVDPGAVTYSENCLSVDDEGWCEQWELEFLTYQIIGVTGTPFPGFEAAAITLGPVAEPVTADAGGCGCGTSVCSCTRRAELSTRRLVHAVAAPAREVITASAAPVAPLDRFDVPLVPPRSWMTDPGFVMPTPLTITNQGRVMAHVAVWNTCHTGHLDRCVTPPSGCDFADFLQGRVYTDDGGEVRTGVLTWRMDHPDHEMTFHEAMSAYGNSIYGWADVVAGEDEFGPWVSGALRPGLTHADVRILRALSLSGDWRVTRRTGRHEFIGGLAVNAPGFPITAAAGALGIVQARPLHSPTVITAANIVPQSARHEPSDSALLVRLEALEAREAGRARAVLQEMHADERDRALARLRG